MQAAVAVVLMAQVAAAGVAADQPTRMLPQRLVIPAVVAVALAQMHLAAHIVVEAAALALSLFVIPTLTH